MNISLLYPSKYVKSMDLGGKDITVEISHLVVEKVGVPPKIEDKPVLYFKRAKRAMILNRTNAMTIAAMLGPETDNWSGHRIVLFPTLVDAFGKTHQVIRVRPELPPSPKPGTPPVEETHFEDAEDINEEDEILNDPTADPVEETPVPTQSNGKPARKLGAATETHLREINALITALHGKKADQERHRLVKLNTNNRTESSKDLTQAEANMLIARLHQELSGRITSAIAEHDLDLETILLAHNQPSLLDASPVALTHIWKEVQEKTQAKAVQEAA